MPKKLTERDFELIEKYAASFTIEKLAKRFNVHPSYMKQVMIKRGLYSPEDSEGYFTASSLGSALGVSHETVRRWIYKYRLPYRHIKRHEGVQPSKLYISINDFWKWAEQHQHLLNFKHADMYQVSPVPHWAQQKKREDLHSIPKQKKWTQAEENRLLFLYYQESKTQEQIAKDLGRTKVSIEKKIKRISDKKMKG